jgi:hypothetical protein
MLKKDPHSTFILGRGVARYLFSPKEERRVVDECFDDLGKARLMAIHGNPALLRPHTRQQIKAAFDKHGIAHIGNSLWFG